MIRRNILKAVLILSFPFLFAQCNFVERQKQKAEQDIAEKIIAEKLKEHKEILENGDGSIAGQMQFMADAINKQCPVMIDEMTRLDNCKYDEANKTIKYYYTITDQSNIDIDVFKSGIAEMLKKTVKDNKEMASIKMLKVNIQYLYVDNSGKELVTVTVTPDDYK